MSKTFAAAALLALGTVAGAAPAMAQADVMKACAAKYQQAKGAGTLPAGQTWMQYLAACRGTVAKTATAPQPTAVAAQSSVAAHTVTTSRTTTRTAGQPTPGQLAARDRQAKCGAQWKADKAAGKIPAGQTWPKYWSQCNARMKG